MVRYFKSIFFFLIIFSFFSFSVYAEEAIPNDGDEYRPYDFTVCGTRYGDCDFTTLDKALTYLERFHFDANKKIYSIDLDDNQVQTLTNHTLDVPVVVTVGLEKNAVSYEDSPVLAPTITIDGGNSTFKTSYGIFFESIEAYISNWNIVYNSSSFDRYIGFAVGINSNRLDLDNVHIKNLSGSHMCDEPLSDNSRETIGLFAFSVKSSSMGEFSFTNSSISGFDIGLTLSGIKGTPIQELQPPNQAEYYHRNILQRLDDVGSLFEESILDDGYPSYDGSQMITIDKSDLYDNLLSFGISPISKTYMMISNSKLTSFLALGSTIKFLEGNSFGDSKLMNMSLPDFSQIEDADAERQKFVNYFCQNVKDKKKAIILKYNDTEKYPTVIEINLEKTEHVNDTGTKISVLDRFIDTTSTDISLFEYKVSDDSVAKMENGNVVLLKNQDVDVVARNRSTNEVYTLHLRMNRSLFQNPVTGTFIVLIIFGILFVISFLFLHFSRKKLISKK